MNVESLEMMLPDTCKMLGSRESGCVVSRDLHYRYALWRIWEPGELFRPMVWCMLNPSTADHNLDDPTIRKCRGFALRHGYPGIVVVNLFGLRATHPKKLLTVKPPIATGFDNDQVVDAVAATIGTKRIWCAWGSSLPQLVQPRLQLFGPFLEQFSLLCLGTSKDGSPRHPLMIGYATEPRPWELRRAA